MRPIDADALIEFCAERWIPLNIDAVNMQPTIQPVATDTNVGDTISRQWLLDCINDGWIKFDTDKDTNRFIHLVRDIAPSAQPEERTEKRMETHACDLISRQAAIDAINHICPVDTEYDCTLLDRVDVRCVLLDLPSAQPEPPWIPCSERMPEDLAEVITTWVNRDPLPYYEFMRDKPFTAVSVHYKGEWYWYSSTCADYLEEYGRNDRDKVDKSIEIIAWMPLPTPYKK